jgi:hypothetical protein
MGSTVHKVIEECLKEIQHSRKLPPVDELQRRVAVAHDTAMNESKERLWKSHPKHHANILEHYYGLPFGKDEEQSSKEKGMMCMANWASSPCVQNLILHPKAEWLGIEASQTFALEKGVEAIVVYDFFLRWPKADGSKTMIIFDWKTGQESQKIEDQLFAYALAATTLFSASPDNLIVTPFYLASGPSGYKKYGAGQETPIDSSRLAATRAHIIDSGSRMLALHPEKDMNGLFTPPDPCQFSYPEDHRRCRRCPFQELCTTAQYQPMGWERLRELIPQK